MGSRRNGGTHLEHEYAIGYHIPPAVGIGSFNRDPAGSASPARSPLGRG
jgi:hypothetical protein